ncbi:hypothetical protein GTA08_BOTSDO07730 [Neofusicoccum parvum]|uniref:Uncharacterized protein n=1 Tax=Neofusicoccum parvum TaxID=310453 RepID=A0ACB5RVD7_9PEZI|nr:hypothetical protein GTA08_BOTSDO07730 [Neofusicoccum parvum]
MSQQHIPFDSSEVKTNTANPNNSNEDDGNQPSGILSKGLTPVGNGLGKVLSPVGAVVGTVTQPVTGIMGGVTKPVLDPALGERQDRSQLMGGDKRAEDFGKQAQKDKEPVGGKEQSGSNPLGL